MSTPSTSNTGETSTVAIVTSAMLLVLVLISIVFLTAIGKPVDNVLYFVGAAVTPTVAALLAIRKFNENRVVLQDVAHKVDSKIDTLMNDRSALEGQVRSAGLDPVTAPMPRQYPNIGKAE